MKLRVSLCCLALLLVLPVAAAAAEVESGSVYCFASEEFGAEQGIFLRSLPEAGTLRLGERILRPGDALTWEQLGQVSFAPVLTEADGQARVCYLPVDEQGVGPETVLTLGIRGKENKPPVAEDSTLETYKNLANTGVLRAQDPEGEALTFTVTRQPRRGDVTISEDGSFTYTPKNNKVGVDSFAYTAADPQGKTSREATVTITILKPAEATAYADTASFTAEWMRSTGIFAGETLAGKPCFYPGKTVSKGEFLTMVVKTLSIPVEQEVPTQVGTNVPQWLRPYAVAALRAGLTADTCWQGDFDAAEPVTNDEAAAILCVCLDTDTAGYPFSGDTPLTRAAAGEALYWLSSELEK